MPVTYILQKRQVHCGCVRGGLCFYILTGQCSEGHTHLKVATRPRPPRLRSRTRKRAPLAASQASAFMRRADDTSLMGLMVDGQCTMMT